MTRAYYVFKPEEFKPLEPGTYLKYLAHEFNYDTKKHHVVFEVLGVPPLEDKMKNPHIQFV